MKRILAYLLSTAMIFTVRPMGVSAEGEQNSTVFSGEPEAAANTAAEPDFNNIDISQNISQTDTVLDVPVEEHKKDGVSNVVLTTAEYEAQMAEMEANGKTQEELAADKEYITLLLRHRLVYKTGYDSLISKMESEPNFKTAIEWLFNDYETLQYYVYGGEPDNWTWDGRTNVATPEIYLKSLGIFSDLYNAHNNDITEEGHPTYDRPVNPDGPDEVEDITLDETKLQNKSLFKRLMVAIALTHSSEICMWNKLSSSNRHVFNLFPKSDPVGRYELYKKLYIHRLLTADFDKYNVDELRMVVSVMIDNTQLEWMNYYYRITFLNDEDYLKEPAEVTEQNVSGWCNMRYTAFCTQPQCMGHGGLGDKYYDDNNREQWTKKYHLKVNDGVVFNFNVPYGPVDQTDKETQDRTLDRNDKYYATRQWIEIEAGSVCFGISNTATVLRCAFGFPTVINEELPNHCAYFEYHHKNITEPVTPNSANLTLGIGYDAYGITSALPYFHRYTLTGWGCYPCSSVRNGIYMVYGMDAIFSRFENTEKSKYSEKIMTGMSDVYLKAFNLRLMGDVQQKIGDEKAKNEESEGSGNSEYEKAIALYNKALTVQDYHFSAFIGLADCYNKFKKSDEEFVNLAKKAAESKMWLYAQPLSDYLINYLVPMMNAADKKADVVFIAEDGLRKAQTLNSNNHGLAQPSYSVAIANYCLATIKKIATFSFESKSITVNADYTTLGEGEEKRIFKYSVDGGTSWVDCPITANTVDTKGVKDTAKAAVFELSADNLSKINVDNGIKYKFEGSTQEGYIAFTTGATPVSNPSKNTQDDNGDRFLNLEKGLEYQTKGHEEDGWQDLTTESRFKDDVIVSVRRKASGTTLPSEAMDIEFTKGEGTPDFSFLSLDDIDSLTVDTNPLSSQVIKLAWDGDPNTYFENQYSTAYSRNPDFNPDKEESAENPKYVAKQEYNFTLKLKNLHYISGISYTAGVAQKVMYGYEVYVSTDGKNWSFAGQANNLSSDTETQILKFETPAYAQYLKISTNNVNEELFMGLAPVSHFTVAEFGLYENYEVADKKPARLTVTKEGDFKENYLVGDKPDLENLKAELVYDDDSTSIIPSDALECNVKIFDSPDTDKLKFKYKGFSDEVDVNVEENTREATKIASVTARDRKYYEGDNIDNEDIEVAVTNENETWYLLPNQFEVSGPLEAGTNDLTVTAQDIETPGALTVEADKAVTGITIEKPEDFKDQYFIGDALDLSGIKVKLNYKDGTEKELSEDEYTLDMYMEKEPEEEAAPEPVALEDENGEEAENKKIIVPIDINDFGKTFGTVNVRVTLNDKADICAEEELTVLSYITNGEFSFNVTDEKSCTLTGYTPSEGSAESTVTVPEKAEINGLTFDVTEIAANAFENAADIDAVSLPPTIKKIASTAFSACGKLKNIYMIYHDDLEGFVCDDDAFVGSGTLYLKSALAAEYTDETPIKNYNIADITKQIMSIKITPPTKLDYDLNEELDKTGMTVKAVLRDGSEVETQNYSVEYDNRHVKNDVQVKVTIDETDVSDTFNINIKFPEINIVKQPVSSDYRPEMPIEQLTFEAAANFNDVKYQWYKCGDKDGNNNSSVNGANTNTYKPESEGFYYAEAYVADASDQKSAVQKSDIVHITVDDYTAIADGRGFSTLKEAMDHATGTAGTSSLVNLYKDEFLNEKITLSGKKHITLEGNHHTVTRGDAKEQMFFLKEKSGLTLSNVTIDGGAKWGGNIDPILQHGLSNQGISVNFPMIEAWESATLNLQNGTVLRNNCNTDIYGYENYSSTGAVKLRGASMRIDDGKVIDNFANNNAAAIYLKGQSAYPAKLYISKGEISGNVMGSYPYYGGAAIYSEGASTITVKDGIFSHNRGNGSGSYKCEGAVFKVLGDLIIEGGQFTDNYVDTNVSEYGGVIAANSNGTVTITDGTFARNEAKFGGVIAANGNSKVTIAGGEFTDNKATSGGVLYYNSSNGTSSISAGVLKNNTADNGSAVYVNNAATFSISGASYEGNTAKESGTVWTNGPLRINSPIFKDNTAQRGGAVYTDYTNYDKPEALAISGLSNEMQDIYMKEFKPITVSANLNGKPLTIQTDSKINDDTVILSLSGTGTDQWNIEGTINGRALTVRKTETYGGEVKRKPFEGMKLAPLPGAVEEHGDTFNQGFTTEVVDPSGCKSLIMTFGKEGESLNVKYPLSELFGGALERMIGDIRFGLIINDIPLKYEGNVGIEFSEDEPNQPNPDATDAESTPEAETGFETEPAPTEDSVIVE